MDKRLEMFKSGKIVVHCDTAEKARKFVQWCYSNGIEWSISDSATTYFYVDEELTCYRCDDMNCLVHESYEYYKTNYKIMSFEEFMGGIMFTKDDLNTGMLVKLRNGELYKVMVDYKTVDCGQGVLVKEHVLMALRDYDYSSLKSNNSREYDIIEIYKPKYDIYALSLNVVCHDLIWKRKEVKEMTMEQLNELLGYEVKIVQ